MKKAKMITAFTLALSLCSVMTACGNANEDNSSSVSSSTVETTEEPTTEESATEETTTEEPTTEEPTTETATEEEPAVDEGITFDTLEEIIPNIYGLSLDEACESVLKSLNISDDNINDDPGFNDEELKIMEEQLDLKFEGNKWVSVTEQSIYRYYDVFPDGYDTRTSYSYYFKDKIKILGAECSGIKVQSYSNDSQDYAYEIQFAFMLDKIDEYTNDLKIAYLLEDKIASQYGSSENDFECKNTPVGNISYDSGDFFYVVLTDPDMDMS